MCSCTTKTPHVVHSTAPHCSVDSAPGFPASLPGLSPLPQGETDCGTIHNSITPNYIMNRSSLCHTGAINLIPFALIHKQHQFFTKQFISTCNRKPWSSLVHWQGRGHICRTSTCPLTDQSAHQLQDLLDSKNSLSQGIGLKHHEAKEEEFSPQVSAVVKKCVFATQISVTSRLMTSMWHALPWKTSFSTSDAHDPLQWNSHLEVLFYYINLNSFIQAQTQIFTQNQSDGFFILPLQPVLRHPKTKSAACLKPFGFTAAGLLWFTFTYPWFEHRL